MSLVDIAPKSRHSEFFQQIEIELLLTIDKIYRYLEQVGFTRPRPLSTTFDRFRALPSEAKQAINRNLQAYFSVLTGFPVGSFDIDTPTLTTERSMTEIALSRFGYTVEGDFFKNYEKGDIIEFYDLNMVQIYRNLEFFKYCSYSLMDLISMEWFELYERSALIVEQIFSSLKSFMETGVLENYDIKEHFITEKLLNVRRVFKVKVKNAYLLRDQDTGEVVGIANVLRIELVASGSDSDQIAII